MGYYYGEIAYADTPPGFVTGEEEEKSLDTTEGRLEKFTFNEDITVYAALKKDKPKKQVCDGIYLHFAKDTLLICTGYLYNYQILVNTPLSSNSLEEAAIGGEILKHYREQGMDWVKDLNGQFSFVICDFTKRECYLGVDRTGIFNLYYAFAEGRMVFATDMKYILKHPAIEKKLNFKALQQMILFCSIASPETIVKGIKSVSGGTYVKILDNNTVEEVVYWDLIYPDKDGFTEKEITESKVIESKITEREYVEQFEEVFTKALLNKADDGGFNGVLLSGGLDSSIVAAHLRKLYPESDLYTFSLDYKFSGLSESLYQNMMVEALKSSHSVKDFGLEEFSQMLPGAVKGAEGPFCELGTCAYFLLYQLAAQQECDVFSGLGADELYAGYITYKADRFKKNNLLLSDADKKINSLLWGDEKFSYESPSYEEEMVWLEQLFTEDAYAEIGKKNCLFEPMFNRHAIGRELETINRRSYIDFKLRLMNHKNFQIASKMSRSYGIRTHYPFLDNRMIDFVCRLPRNMRLKGNTDKYIVREAAKTYIPPDIINRKKISLGDFTYSEVIGRLLKDYEKYFKYEFIKKNNLVSYDFINGIISKLNEPKSALDRFREKNIILTYLTLSIFMDIYKIQIY
ncbi:asparagine synthase-related protein [Anaerocolumna sp. AGMB13020]|uniref:asparagine synthetase B family protein n=1 Tax=Anaerocolumna sp. AGMB13020 TaxID=3081750 RepID=UPI0029529657|nr:asparagine synthase-related protein [Anaerocolumna sp. AGMB13020]WOO34830.1 asparagine synthase-related protein [Anaerocolumna sp. AGMB13020]